MGVAISCYRKQKSEDHPTIYSQKNRTSISINGRTENIL